MEDEFYTLVVCPFFLAYGLPKCYKDTEMSMAYSTHLYYMFVQYGVGIKKHLKNPSYFLFCSCNDHSNSQQSLQQKE